MILFFFFGGLVMGQSSSIIGSKHDLSVSGGGLKLDSETRICIFCHTPHNSNNKAPLWNRPDHIQSYTLYNDDDAIPTLDATMLQPIGSSLLCLSCHDGTIALGSMINSSNSLRALQSGDDGFLGTDLSDDHPVSFKYSDAATPTDPNILANPSPPASLDASGNMQCASCHDAHNNVHGKFLVASNLESALCMLCHDIPEWDLSAHEMSTATYTGPVGNSPWEHIGSAPVSPHITSPPYSTVAENACANCHDTHSENGSNRLLKDGVAPYLGACLDCHNGNVSAANIYAQTSKPHGHNIGGNPNAHEANEPVLSTSSHVECQDCHNPHEVKIGQPLLGVKGIAQDGLTTVDPITFEYELCNRCHSSSAVIPVSTLRQLGDNNVMNDFEPTNISHHAVVEPGNNASPRGLIAPLTSASQILCSDCHASDGAGAPAGPHGSIYPRILKYNYNLNATTGLANHNDATLTAEFNLCVQCHDVTAVNAIHSGMKGGHFLGYTSCNSCHDPHGYSGGNDLNNSYLINLTTADFGPNRNGDTHILISGDGTGECNFVCHAKTHKHVGSSYTNGL